MSANGERLVSSVLINGKKGAKDGKNKPARARKPAKAPKKPKRGSKRRKNPSLDLMGHAKAALGGFTAEIVTTPAAHFAGKLAKEDGLLRSGLKGATGALVGVAGGVAIGMVAPNFGKGMSGVGGSQLARNIASGVAFEQKDVGILAKAGFAQLSLPDGVYKRDGLLYQKASDGKEKLLLGFPAPRSVDLVMEDGTRKSAMLLGRFASGDGLAIDSEGEMRVLAGAIVEAYPDLSGGARQGSARQGSPVMRFQSGLGSGRQPAGPAGWSENRVS